MVMIMNHRKVPVSKLKDGNLIISSDDLAVESVVHLYFNEEKIATLLASPNDCENLFIGHLLTEGYIKRSQAKICSIDVKSTTSKDGIKVQINSSFPLLTKPKITGITTTSCGACNTDGLDMLIADLPMVKGNLEFDKSILYLGLEKMRSLQDGFSKTGGMHSAGILNHHGELKYLSEDIGRHNAVDKVVGKSIEDDTMEEIVLLLSGRCGWDIVAKAARSNISVIASIGACSTLAAECARKLGITIYSFVKPNSATIIG